MSNEITLEDINKIEEELFFSDDSDMLPPSDIVAFNELRSCSDLVRMYQSEQLNIQPDFQRDIVWSNSAQTRFIDSLIKQLPIPSICISLDYRTEKRIVIDGLQRMNSIIKFLSDEEWLLSKLNDIDMKISGKSVSSIKKKNSALYSRVENFTIPVTVIRCDFSKRTHMNYLFTIFHRLNTGGIKLNNQEIRNCIYSGKLNNLLIKLTKYETFIKLFNLESDKNYRFSYDEQILRFFAFIDNKDNYHGKLSLFLNEYMSDNRNPDENFLRNKEILFKKTVDILFVNILESKEIERISKTTIEGLFFGIASNVEQLINIDNTTLQCYYDNLINDRLFSLDNLKDNPSNSEKVIQRLERAKEIFSGN